MKVCISYQLCFVMLPTKIFFQNVVLVYIILDWCSLQSLIKMKPRVLAFSCLLLEIIEQWGINCFLMKLMGNYFRVKINGRTGYSSNQVIITCPITELFPASLSWHVGSKALGQGSAGYRGRRIWIRLISGPIR